MNKDLLAFPLSAETARRWQGRMQSLAAPPLAGAGIHNLLNKHSRPKPQWFLERE